LAAGITMAIIAIKTAVKISDKKNGEKKNGAIKKIMTTVATVTIATEAYR
jgi:hypothetical protein